MPPRPFHAFLGALGASAVQMGTAYLFCPESRISPPHRAALKSARDDATVITTVYSGRPARMIVNRIELGPLVVRFEQMSPVPDFFGFGPLTADASD